jgi:hypothetical protein
MTDSEKETLSLMQERDGRRCPNCFLVIEKDGGCNSMYCEGCKKYFDWTTAAGAVPGGKREDEYADLREAVVCEAEAVRKV